VPVIAGDKNVRVGCKTVPSVIDRLSQASVPIRTGNTSAMRIF
jgi:hypothetical protein